MILWPWLIFVILIGACVGSFLNVVIYRLPAGESLVKPASHCPKCGHSLAWFENVPVLGWLWLGGKCRHCKTKISIQYPLIEALCALLFAGVFVIYYDTHLRPAFAAPGLPATWPVLAVQLVMIAGLLAATVIDARLYIIPTPIPWTIAIVAAIVLPIAAALGGLPADLAHAPIVSQIAPVVGPIGIGVAIGGTLGLVIAWSLLRTGLLPRSFDELEEQLDQPNEPDAFLDHPHPRREVLKELLFVLAPLLGMILGGFIAQRWFNHATPALPWGVLAGVVCGFFAGGGLVWATRILGTLGFGKEAMGLGDVYLLAAIAAVLGPVDAIFVFFIAPFMGLAAALVMAGISAIVKGELRVIPYGPYLAGAALVTMIFRHPLFNLFITPHR